MSNSKVINIIKNSIKNNKLSHAYLFYGDAGVEVETESFNTIKLILETFLNKQIDAKKIEDINYYDLKIIRPNKELNILKENVDNTISNLFETPLEKGGIKILYINQIDKGNKYSLNRLLKFIEEPVDNLIIIMDTNYFNSVLSTIRSRSQNIFVKRQNILEKINLMKDIKTHSIPLIANIYPNLEAVSKIDLDLFNSTYEKVLNSLNESLKNKYYLKGLINDIWNKNNNDYLLSILQFFFYQIMTSIDQNNPLFPKQNNLIMNYKTKNIDCFFILSLIENIKNGMKHYANFNLQKINFLNQLESLI